jgi:hypothetical protein
LTPPATSAANAQMSSFWPHSTNSRVSAPLPSCVTDALAYEVG